MATKKKEGKTEERSVETTADVLDLINKVQPKDELRDKRIAAILEGYGSDPRKLAEVLHDTAMEVELQKTRDLTALAKPDARIVLDGNESRQTEFFKRGWVVLSIGEGEEAIDLGAFECHWNVGDQHPDGSPGVVYAEQNELFRGIAIGKYSENLETLAKMPQNEGGAGAETEERIQSAVRGYQSVLGGYARATKRPFGLRNPVFKLNPALIDMLASKGIELRGTRRPQQ